MIRVRPRKSAAGPHGCGPRQPRGQVAGTEAIHRPLSVQ